MEKQQWSGKTGGTLWMQQALIVMYRMAGLRFLYGIMSLVVPFYMLFNRKGFGAMYHFFRQRMGYGRLKSFVNVYRNHYLFGQIILDRFAAFAGRRFNLKMEGYDRFLRMTEGSEGFIMLSSHVGNYELAGYTLVSEKKEFKALVYGGETATVMANRMRVLGKNHIGLIPLKEDLSHVFLMNETLLNGGILSMSGDRVTGSRTIACTFFGVRAQFPIGPFMLAVKRNVKILAVFVMKQSLNDYHVYIKEITADTAGCPQNIRIQRLAQAFACELEQVVSDYPQQWFNYYDFWK